MSEAIDHEAELRAANGDSVLQTVPLGEPGSPQIEDLKIRKVMAAYNAARYIIDDGSVEVVEPEAVTPVVTYSEKDRDKAIELSREELRALFE